MEPKDGWAQEICQMGAVCLWIQGEWEHMMTMEEFRVISD